MTLEQAFDTKESNLKFRLLTAIYSGIARQQKWVADFVNWTLGAAGIYSTALIANLDKLQPLLKPNWLCGVIIFLAISTLIGVFTRIALAWSDSALQVQAEMEAKGKEWFKDLDNQKHDWRFIQQFGKTTFKITTETAKIAICRQPRPFRWFSKWMIKNTESELEIGSRVCFQIYWCSIWALGFQIASLALAILWPLMRLKGHVH